MRESPHVPVVPDRQGTPVEFHVWCELAFSGVEGGRDRGAVVEARPHVGEFGGVTGAPLVAGDRREPRSGAVVELVLLGVRGAKPRIDAVHARASGGRAIMTDSLRARRS